MIAAALARSRERVVEAYRHQAVAFLTQHGKEQVVAPVLHAAVGCRVERVSGYDTDLLGTFTRELPRAGTQIEAARTKAKLGMQMTGFSLGLASEGSFGGDPMLGMLPWNREMLVWIDAVHGLEIVGFAQGKAHFCHLLAIDWMQAAEFARRWDFPSHHIIVRPETDSDPRIRKGISSWVELEDAFAHARQQSASGRVFLETDVRAYANPTRLQTIRQAAEDLASKLQSACPACAVPGFWIVERLPGLPCKDCGAPTSAPKADIDGCIKCAHRVIRERGRSDTADPSRCDYCNP